MRNNNLEAIWTEFEEIFSNIDEYRKEFNAEAPTLFGEIKTKLMNSGDACFMQSQLAYEWAIFAQPFLETYVTKTALKKILNDGVATLSNNQKKLDQILQSMDAMQSQIIGISSKFNYRFVEKMNFVSDKLNRYRAVSESGPNGPFEKQLQPKVQARMQALKQFDVDAMSQFNDNMQVIGNQRTKVMDEIEHISNLEMKIYPIIRLLDAELDASYESKLATYAQDLFAACKRYSDRYNDKENLI